MSTKRRSFSELVEQGRAQSVVPTSALLDPSTLANPGFPEPLRDADAVAEGADDATTDAAVSVERGSGPAGVAEIGVPDEGVVIDVVAPHVRAATMEPRATENDTDDTDLVDGRGDVSAQDEAPQGTAGSLADVLALLPDEHEVLRTGVRRGSRRVRDVTYELPATTYFALNRLKNDLSKVSDRRVTIPAVVEAALSQLPDSTATTLDLLRKYDTAGLLRSGPQRRLSARIGEERYHVMRDLGVDLYEQTGERVPGSEIWTLAMVLLLELAGR